MSNNIPNIFHFIYGLESKFGDKPFSLAHYLAVKSAYLVNKPDKIFIYYKFEPKSIWWEKLKPLAELVKISVPSQIFGNPLCHYAHKSDVLRLLILLEFGGVYMDIDTICIKPFQQLYRYTCVMGRELFSRQEHGLCNAVILATKKNLFINYWLSTYQTFRSKGKDIYWAEHSVRMPLKLAQIYPELIHIEKEDSFFYPSYNDFGLKSLFEKNDTFPNAYCFHLWESLAYQKYLKDLTEEKIKAVDTSYNIVARKYL